MRPRLAVLVALGSLACGGGAPQAPTPQSLQQTLTLFMAAVKANDLDRLGTLWGSDRGPASEWMKPEELKMRVAVIQKYLNHVGYRVVEGPTPVPGHDDQRTFKIDLQRSSSCTVTFPIELVRTHHSTWVVNDVSLGTLPTPGAPCR